MIVHDLFCGPPEKLKPFSNVALGIDVQSVHDLFRIVFLPSAVHHFKLSVSFQIGKAR